MLDKVIENNRVSIIGEVVSEFEFSHWRGLLSGKCIG